jgi:hypothetical protein
MARKSGKELRKDYQELLDKTKAMQKRFVKRAEELIKQYPDVPYGKSRWKDDEVMTIGDYKRYYVVTPSIALRIIELVEEHIANQHPHQQQNLPFNS